ncbi:GNAT family N-acetyltransferase [Alkalibacillus salilacus]|uniref:Ribosomal protein S18 acetylase RimI-like enzyme n=1 Tax=Alkalibacillus salilacus TaxID=284582 RepID=A0ABT9VFH0_9BACI|nr:GNAT family N-acetyltransferase [Alkalibacillus salilacus]MDQ0159713.1 ribosomal protein S18 acetylase RimI-like enzyme [Alkalibacillus salilacus]
MLEIRMIDKEDLGSVSGFISQMNISEESHIGYCGKDKNEIAKYMVNDISDVKYTDSFVVAYEGNKLVGVLGFDADLDDNSAEIWGPFILREKWNIVYEMWKKMAEMLPKKIDSLEMFPNVKNTRVCQLSSSLSFKKYSDETILIFQGTNSHELKSTSVEELSPEYFVDMVQLHDEAFPNTYYNGQQIIKRLDDHKKVFIITNEGQLCGYIYVEAEPEFGEASIEFFAVEKSERGNGIGAQLLTGALKWLFTFEGMDSITLCVNSANVNAINLYKKVGFEHLHDLYTFTKNIGQK